jgi:hypothetical protein
VSITEDAAIRIDFTLCGGCTLYPHYGASRFGPVPWHISLVGGPRLLQQDRSTIMTLLLHHRHTLRPCDGREILASVAIRDPYPHLGFTFELKNTMDPGSHKLCLRTHKGAHLPNLPIEMITIKGMMI